MTNDQRLTANDVFLSPDWPAPPTVRAYTTLRQGGVSHPPFDSWNLASHVDDDPVLVQQNRSLLMQRLELPSSPFWLDQVHGHEIATPAQDSDIAVTQADGSYTDLTGKVCVVLTADCLPVLICNRQGTEVAAVHAGWRGLAAGVIEAAMQKFSSPRQDLLVWLGPAIGPQSFEVGAEVRQAFIDQHAQTAEAFTVYTRSSWLADIYQLARIRLQAIGVEAVYGGGLCTVSDTSRFFSYRRDQQCGRMASLIWIDYSAH